MKKGYIFAMICCLFTACDKTENEQEMFNVFFGESTNDNKYSYDQVERGENVYFQDFLDPTTADWKAANDEYGTREIKNGHLVIRAKKSCYITQNFTINQNNDFQIEIFMSLDFTSVEQGRRCGIIYGVDNNAFNLVTFLNQTDLPLYIGEFDGSSYKRWYEKISVLATNVHYLYTIRKSGSKISFYVDKEFKYETGYKQFASNYGFLLPEQGEISVDYVRVDYIEAVME